MTAVAAGALLVSCTIVAAGIKRAAAIRAEEKQLRSLLKLLNYIREKIDSYGMPIDKIIESFHDETLEKAGFLAGKAGLEPDLDALCVNESTVLILREFFAGLGKSFRDEQIRHCDRYIELLGEELSRTDNELPRRLKLCATLSFCAAAMTLIIFL